MSTLETLEVVFAAVEIIAACLLFFIPNLKGTPMPVPAEIQAQLDAIAADVATIADKISASEAAATAGMEQQTADTLAAVTDLATKVHTAVSQ